MAPISIGEIHVSGGSGLVAARCLTLTSPVPSSEGLELFFALLAAETPKRVIEKLAERLAEDIRPVFFQKGPPEARFEAALKQANKTILAFLYEHGLSLPGIKLRGTAAALSNGNLYVASRGAVRGLLYLPQAQTLVPYALFGETPEKGGESKFFTSLQTGAFPDGGRLVIATSELFQALDEAYTRSLLGQSDFAKASREVKLALRNARLPVSILSLSSPLPEGVHGQEPAAPPVKSPRPHTPRSQRLAAPIAGPDIGELIARILRQAGRLLIEWLGIGGTVLWRAAKWLARLPLRLPRAMAVLADRESRARLLHASTALPGRCLSAAVQRLNALTPRSRTRFLLLVAVGTLFLHGLAFSFRRELVVREAKAYESKLAELQQLESDFDAGMLYDSDDRNRERLARMDALVDSLPEKTSTQQKSKADARRSIGEQRVKFRRITAIDHPVPFASLESSTSTPSAMSWFGGKLYLFSSDSGQVRVFSGEGAAQADQEIAGLQSVIAVAPAQTGFLLEDASGKIAYWNPDTGETTVYTDGPAAGTPILFYQGRLYAAGADGTVNRRPVTLKALGTTVDVLRGAPAAPSGMAADGAIYLLYPDGSTKKYLKGAAVQEYNPSAIDPAPAQAGGLWASADSGRLVFGALGGDRLYVVDKTTGRLISQLTAPEFKGVRAVAVDVQGNNAYVLAGSGTIYQVPIK